MICRRGLLWSGGLALAGLVLPPFASGGVPVAEIAMDSSGGGAKVWFDPVGIHVEPGTTVRWIVRSNVHTATAYHPANDMHARRIPETAKPWDSGYLVEPGQSFEVKLTVPGVYDYYCRPHELAGMVGRIVVGRPGGIATLPVDRFREIVEAQGWKPVPERAMAAFPPIEKILDHGVVRGGPR
jgi:plastocyanin